MQLYFMEIMLRGSYQGEKEVEMTSMLSSGTMRWSRDKFRLHSPEGYRY